MEEIRFKPTIFVLIAIIGAVAIAATGFLSTDWMLTTAVSVVLFLLSYVWFFSVRKRIDEILTHDLDKIANDAARAIREELESSSQGGGDRSSHEKDKNLELKEKELLTKEKELALREKEISSREKEIQKNKDDLDSKKKSFEQASSIPSITSAPSSRSKDAATKEELLQREIIALRHQLLHMEEVNNTRLSTLQHEFQSKNVQAQKKYGVLEIKR